MCVGHGGGGGGGQGESQVGEGRVEGVQVYKKVKYRWCVAGGGGVYRKVIDILVYGIWREVGSGEASGEARRGGVGGGWGVSRSTRR